MQNYNRVILTGRCGSNPKFHAGKDGDFLAIFSLATTSFEYDKEAQKKLPVTHWHNINVYNKFIIERIKKYEMKGILFTVDGEIRYEKWLASDGQNRTITKIIVPSFSGDVICMEKNAYKSTEEILDDELPEELPI